MNARRTRISFAVISLGWITIIVAATVSAAQNQSATPAQQAAIARAAGMKVSAQAQPPEIIVVRVHHDMCPFCKQFDPQFAELIRRTKDESVLFVTFDLSSEETQRRSALLAGALGLEKLWPANLSTLSTVTFVDGKSKRVLSSFRAIDAENMQVFDAKTLQTRLRDASGSLR